MGTLIINEYNNIKLDLQALLIQLKIHIFDEPGISAVKNTISPHEPGKASVLPESYYTIRQCKLD